MIYMLHDEEEVRKNYEELVKYLIERCLTITTMESATGGEIASLITDTEGASAILKGAFVTYSNDTKIMQGVNKETINLYGVYSIATAISMATACKARYNTDIGIGITGSFENVDLNNSDSIPGIVYFSVVNEDNEIRTGKLILPTNISRHQSKIEVAQAVYEKLKEILKMNK